MNDLHFAVTIGIDRYPGFPGKDLRSARADAAAFHEWLIDPQGGGLPAANAILVAVEESQPFASLAEARPAIGQINHALHEINRRIRAHPTATSTDWKRTRLYLYVAGHGVGPMLGEAALILADADEETLNNSIGVALYAEWYEQCSLVHEVVVFADCCREVTKGADKPYGPPFGTCELGESGTIVLKGYASRLGEQAWEPRTPDERDAARGYFTRALLEGLRGKAPPNPETGAIDAAGLAQYVQTVVAQRTKTAPYPQQGSWPGDLATARSIVFGRPPAPPVAPRFVAAIHPPAGQSAALVVVDGQERVLGRWQAGDEVPWQVPLTPGLYEVRHDPADPLAPPLARDGLFRVPPDGNVDVRL